MERPANIGILAMEMYTPMRYVSQTDMEAADNCAGKYTIGLGQQNMAFSDDREDIASIMLTALHSLLEKYSIDVNKIGRIEVGTETLTDKSKSVKTSLMRLFGGNTDLEGVTNVNACYGGTAALFNSIAWIESSEWDGRYAVVVCGDIAVYAVGPARPTGGCGALAILIGPDAPLAIEPGVRATHAMDLYDFYKPNHSEYALVDGKLSQWAYLSSVDKCYERYKTKYQSRYADAKPIDVDHFDYFAFHSPYNKLVQKGFCRLFYSDYMGISAESSPSCTSSSSSTTDRFDSVPEAVRSVSLEDSYESREVEAAFKSISAERFSNGVLPACRINQNVGNCYTGSVFSSLLSLICEIGSGLDGKRVMMFSYGSGSVASVYSFVGRSTASEEFSLSRIQSVVDIFSRLDSRTRCTVEEFSEALGMRADAYGKAPLVPLGSIEKLFPGTYFLENIDDKHHRTYSRKSL